MFKIRGMSNKEFADLANGLLEQKDSLDTIELLEYNDNKESTNKEMQWGNVAKILYYAGKEKLVTIINNKKNVNNLNNILYFVDKDGKEFKIYWNDIVLEKNLSLNVNNFYAVKYDKKTNLYNIIYTDFKFDINIVKNYINKLDIKSKLNCNDEIINKEIRIVEKYEKIMKIFKYTVFLILLVLAILFNLSILSILLIIKIEGYVVMLALVIGSAMIIYPILMIYFMNKIKQIY